MNYIYEEKQSVSPIFTVISVAVIILLIFQLIFVESARQDKAFLIIAPVIIILMLVVAINFSLLKIKLTESILGIGFGLFKKKFYIKNLQQVEIADYKFSNYGGYGIRFGRDKSKGFIARGGQGIKFLDTASNKIFYFSTNSPEQIFNLLLNYGAQKKT